jgi:hypothetical protein
LSLLYNIQTVSGAHTASYPMSIGEALSPGIKRPGHEAENSTSFSDNVKSDGAITPLPTTSLWRGAYISKHRDNFAFYLLQFL